VIARVRKSLRAGSDDGLSLVELLVAMLLTGIVLSLVGSLFVNVALVTSASNASTTKSSAAANALNEMVEVVRAAANNAVSTTVTDPAVVSATSTALTIYSFADTSPTAPAPIKVAFRMDGTNLVEDRYSGSNSTGYWVFSGTPTTRVIGNAVVTNGADPLFAYLAADGSVVGAPAVTALTLDQRKTITSVRITVTIANQSRTGDSPIIIVNTVGMPNLTTSGKVK